MKLLRKSRYALRALIDLSVHERNCYVTLNSIAQRNQISQLYLEQIFSSLRRAGIVKGVKGHQGGYVLGKTADKITVAMILQAVEGDYRYEKETEEDGICRGACTSVQKLVVDQANGVLEQFLNNLTLEDLKKDYEESVSLEESMYYI